MSGQIGDITAVIILFAAIILFTVRNTIAYINIRRIIIAVLSRISRKKAAAFVCRGCRHDCVTYDTSAHLFVDKPVSDHFCDYVWSYSGGRLYPQLPRFATRKIEHHDKFILSYASITNFCIYRIKFGRAGQGRIPYIITGFISQEMTLAVVPATIDLIGLRAQFPGVQQRALILNPNVMWYQSGKIFPRDTIFQFIVMSGIDQRRIPGIIRRIRGHRDIFGEKPN